MVSANDRLVVEDLCKEYPTPGEPLRVLRGLSLELSPGERLAVVGVSGSGKTTLLNILGTLDKPSSGQVRLGEVDVPGLRGRELSEFRGRRVGFVFQDHHLLPQLSAMENVLVAALAVGKVRPEDHMRAEQLLDRVGLSQRAGHVPGELSGGERQRVAVARAMMNAPALLLCDEPTGNLDARSAELVGRLLLELSEESGAILIVATHSADLSARVGRRRRLAEGTWADEP